MRFTRIFTGARLGGFTLVVWFAVMVVLGAGLLARHAVALPAPSASPELAASMDTLRRPENRGEWLAVHVLYAQCRCSQRIVEHLLETARPRDWSELVLWVGNPAPPPALEQRFDVRRIDAAQLARLGVESAPLLVAVRPDGGVRYAGGYTDRKQGPVIDDLRILQAARKTDVIASLPVFGCAVSDRLKRGFMALPVL
jgi:hypothetical protein